METEKRTRLPEAGAEEMPNPSYMEASVEYLLAPRNLDKLITEETIIPESDALRSDYSVPLQLVREKVQNVLAILSERERTVVQMRFGLEDGNSKTQKATGEAIGRSARTVGRIEKSALNKIREVSFDEFHLPGFFE